jgi:hypothetical protein
MCAVSATGTPFGYSSVRLPGSGTSGTVPTTMLSSPAPRSTTVVTAVSFERTWSSPPSVKIDSRSMPRMLTIVELLTLAWMKPTELGPEPAELSAIVSGASVPKKTRPSVPEPPPESTMSTPVVPPATLVMT